MNIPEIPPNEFLNEFPNSSLDNSFGNEMAGEDISMGTRMNLELRDTPEITFENFDFIEEEISKKIGIKEEEDIVLLESMMGLRLNIGRNIERVKMGSKEKSGLLRDFAVEDAEWMDLIVEHIKSINNDSKLKKKDKLDKVHLFWKDLEKAYKDFEIYYKDFINGLEESGYGFDDRKKGILGQVGAEDLMNGINEVSEELNIEKISVRSSTSKEDVDEKIDFLVDIEYSNGLTETMPCQAKARKSASNAGRFIFDNLVTKVTRTSHDELKLSRDIKVPSAVEEKTIEDLEIFKKRALKKYKEGLFIMVPYGKAVYRKTKRKVEEVNLLEENGQVHKHLKEAFMSQLKERGILDLKH